MSATGYEETELNYAATEDMEDEQGAEEDEEEEIDEDEDETSKGKVSWDSSIRWFFTIILSRVKDETFEIFFENWPVKAEFFSKGKPTVWRTLLMKLLAKVL
jgi:hypothetical protein